MPKRFIDTEVLNNPSIRDTPTPYKLFWVGLLTRCDHAGIWAKDFEMMSLLVGEKIEEEKVLEYFADDLVEVDKGRRYFIPKFIDFQYKGELNPKVAAHKSVLEILKKNGIETKCYLKTLVTPSKGLQDKDMDKDKDKDKDKVKVEAKEPIKLPFESEQFRSAWVMWEKYRKEIRKPYKSNQSRMLALARLKKLGEKRAIAAINFSISQQYQGIYEESGKREIINKPQSSGKWAK